MQTHYGISAEEIFAMSFRRFVILFRGIFSWNEDALPKSVTPDNMPTYERAVHEARGAKGEILHSIDWDAALGRTPADRREIITTDDLMNVTKSGKMDKKQV